MKNRLTVAIADIIIGALIALIPFNLLPVCGHEEKKMACFFTAKAEVVLGIAIAFLGIIYLFSKCKGVRLGITIAQIINAAISVVFLKIIGLCKMASMACQVKTKPAIIVAAISLLVVQAANIIILSKKGNKDEENSEVHTKEDKE